MRRLDCFRHLARRRRDEIVICAIGANCGEWHLASGMADAFYMRGAMGTASSVGLGVALAQPHRRVWVLDADGGLAMNLGTLLTLASVSPPNLIHFVSVNRRYESAGGRLLVNADKVDFADLARVAGYPRVLRFDTFEQFGGGIDVALEEPGLALIALEVDEGHEAPLRTPFESAENYRAFVRGIRAPEPARAT